MPTIEQALALAGEHQRAGRVVQAQGLCRQILEVDPSQAGAWRLLGLSQHAQRRIVEAEESYRRALSIRPGDADAANYLGIALAQQGKLQEAIEAYQVALRLRPH